MDGQYIIQKYQQFQQKRQLRQKIKISLDTSFDAELDMMQYIILSKFQKNAKNLFKEKKNKQCDKVFKRGFKELTDIQKFYYYIMIICYLQSIANRNLIPPICQTGNLLSPAYSKTYSKIGWKQVALKIDFDKKYIYIQRQNKLRAYDLRLYLLRKSKATQYNSFVLEAINQVVKEKGYQIHIGFKDVKIFRQWYQKIKKLIEYIFWEKIRQIVYPGENFNGNIEETQIIQQKKTQQVKSQKFINQQNEQRLTQSTVITSNRFLGEELPNMAKTAIKRVSQSQSEKNQDMSNSKSCRSIEIKSSSPRSSIKEIEYQIQLQNQTNQQDSESFKSFGRLVGDDIQSQLDQTYIFRRLLPQYNLESISKLQSWNQQIYSSQKQCFFKMYSNTLNPKKIKVFIIFQSNQSQFENFASLFCSPQFSKLINNEIQEVSIKTNLTSDNSVILYQKNRPYNKLYRSRDFVFIRHQFFKNNKLYIVDKSVQDSTIPPFTTIVRGETVIVYEILYDEKQNVRINIDATIQNSGYLKDLQQLNINIKYFKGYENILQKMQKLKLDKKSISLILEVKWPKKNEYQIQKKQNHVHQKSQQLQNGQSDVEEFHLPAQQVEYVSKKDELKQKQERNEIKKQETLNKNNQKNQPNFFETLEKQKFAEFQIKLAQNKIQQQIAQSVENMQVQGQISMIDNQIKKIPVKIIRIFDTQGKVIINNSFLSKRQQIFPFPLEGKQFAYLKSQFGQNPIWKGNWEFPLQGGLKFINKKQIQNQKGVLRFILSQVAKNVISGKSILNISLPVDIFSSQSNLERFIYGMSYGPYILERAAKMTQVDRFVNTIAFAMTNSPLYLDMEKPFNPILGQTFQCYINGCPAYAQQISHHPPIAAFMLVGRGYKVSAQIQSKMKLNINSGTGMNQGVYRTNFDDGQQICYICPSGEVSGLAYGDRKFNMIDKAYGWSEKQGYFLQISFNPKRTYFGKQQTPVDYVQGKILKVKPTFFKSFTKNYSGYPKKNDIIQQLGKFHGQWPHQLNYEEQVLFNYKTQYPLEIEYQQNPLASDSTWRQDIAYRRILSISQAQVWKEKLEVQQRNQRKLREKYSSFKK